MTEKSRTTQLGSVSGLQGARAADDMEVRALQGGRVESVARDNSLIFHDQETEGG